MQKDKQVSPDNPNTAQRYAAYGVIGAVVGGAVVWIIADSFSFATLGSGLAGGAVAGVIAGIVRTRAGLDG